MIESVHGAFAPRQQADILIPLEPKYPHRIFYNNVIYYYSVFCVNLWVILLFLKKNNNTIVILFLKKADFCFHRTKTGSVRIDTDNKWGAVRPVGR